MSKRLELSGASHCRMKTNREENLTKYAGSIYAYAKKVGKMETANDDKGRERAEKTRHIIENET